MKIEKRTWNFRGMLSEKSRERVAEFQFKYLSKNQKKLSQEDAVELMLKSYSTK